MADPIFARSPLITPERLTADHAEALRVAPEWARGGSVQAPDLPMEDDVFVVRLGDALPTMRSLAVPSAAVLFELTRFGNSVTTNRNKAANSPQGRIYAKLTFALHPEDTMPISRIIMDAGPHESVHGETVGGDLRPEMLSRRGAGKPTKDAREVAIRHAVELAHQAGADAAAHEHNVRALLDLHDTLLLGAADY